MCMVTSYHHLLQQKIQQFRGIEINIYIVIFIYLLNITPSHYRGVGTHHAMN